MALKSEEERALVLENLKEINAPLAGFMGHDDIVERTSGSE